MNDIPDPVRDCWFLTGATASGKTSVSVELAKRIDAEIISMDSMAIYRGMDIGTAKPAAAVRESVPHHLIDIVEPDQRFSVAQYRAAAVEAISAIQSRHRQVLFVGGTALYLKTLLRGLFDGPPADEDFRRQIEADATELGTEVLHERLKMIDPLAADQIHPNDLRRLVRALEVFRATGQPVSHQQMEFESETEPDNCRVFAIRHPREELHRRIEERVDSMFSSGLIDEAAALRQQYATLSQTASQAVGYRESFDHLDGLITLDQAIEKVRIRTRRFARQQETWFRNLTECRMIDITSEFDAGELADRLVELGNVVV